MRRANREINFRLKASPGRGKLSPQVTDEGVGKLLFAGNYPSSVCSLRSHPPSPQGVKAFALLIFVPGKNFAGIICRR